MDHPTPTSPLVTAAHCANLRHKGMYVMAEPDPNESRFFDAYEPVHALVADRGGELGIGDLRGREGCLDEGDSNGCGGLGGRTARDDARGEGGEKQE